MEEDRDYIQPEAGIKNSKYKYGCHVTPRQCLFRNPDTCVCFESRMIRISGNDIK
jgi:hypothetical protein